MKKFRLILLSIVACISLLIPFSTVSAVQIVTQNLTSLGEGYGNAIYSTTHRMGQTFQYTTTFQITSVRVRIEKYGSPTGTINATIWSVDVNHLPLTLLSTASNPRTVSTIPATYTWDTYTFPNGTGAICAANTEYALVMQATAGDSSNYVRSDNSDTSNPYTTGRWLSMTDGATWSASATIDLAFVVNGTYRAFPMVTTVSAKIKLPDTITLYGSVDSLGEDTLLTLSFDVGFDTDYSLPPIPAGTSKLWGGSSLFFADIMKANTASVYHYRAKAVGTLSGTIFGADKTAQIGASNAAKIETLPITDVTSTGATFGIFLASTGNETWDTLKIEWSKDGTFTDNNPSPGYNILASTVSVIDQYSVTLAGFAPATTYFARARATRNTTIDIYGKTKTFTTIDPTKPPVVNSWIDWLSQFGFTGTGIWWLIDLALSICCVIFLWSHKVIALVLILLIQAVVITLSLVDIWFVALLALVAGIAVVLIVRNASAGGE